MNSHDIILWWNKLPLNMRFWIVQTLFFLITFRIIFWFRPKNKSRIINVKDILKDATDSYLAEQKRIEDKKHLKFYKKFEKQVGRELAMAFDIFPHKDMYRLEANGVKIWTQSDPLDYSKIFFYSGDSGELNETNDIREIILAIEKLNLEKTCKNEKA